MITIIGFGMICMLAGSGKFDHWKSRYKIKMPESVKIPVI